MVLALMLAAYQARSRDGVGAGWHKYGTGLRREGPALLQALVLFGAPGRI